MTTYLPIFEQTRAAVPTPLIFAEPLPARPVAETDPAVAELVRRADETADPHFMRADGPIPLGLKIVVASYVATIGGVVWALVAQV